MIGAINQNYTHNTPSFKAIIPIKSVNIAKNLNTEKVFETEFEQVFDEKQTRSLVNQLKNVLFKKTTLQKTKTIKGKKFTTPAEESDNLTKALYNRIRNRFAENSEPKDYVIYPKPSTYNFYDKHLRFFHDKNRNNAYILTGNEAKLLDTAGKNYGIEKNYTANIAKRLGEKAGKEKEELKIFVDNYIEKSPVMQAANIKFAQTIEKLLNKINPEQKGIHLYGVEKPGSTTIKPVGIRFE